MKIRFILSAAAALLGTFLLSAKEYDHVLLYKNCGTWEKNCPVIQSGFDAGRIAWNGRTLKFVPRGGSFDLKNIYCFGFAMRVPENMINQPITVKFIYEEGKPVLWDFRTPGHTGWQGANAKIQAGKWPFIRPGKLKAVEFSAKVPEFQAMLDDLRFVPDGLDFQLEEMWIPPVTNGCFFPEYTLEQQQKETLTDPEFKAKMAEIEQLRKDRLKIRLKRQHTDPKELPGIPEINRIRPDGSVEGLSYEDVIKIHKQKRFWHDVNETYMTSHCAFYNRLLLRWEWGRVPRTEENRRKLFRSLIRTMTAESNRRQERFRYIVPAFVMPSTAAWTYRIFFDEMDAVEKGTSRDPDAILLNRLLKEAVSWCYTHVFYRTIAPALTTESFRGDSAWTGGNFSYRPTFWAALICRNPKMLEVISEVAKGSLGITSYNTRKNAFWMDGMTADGSAWGHWNQNYPFGYPLDGFLGIGELIGNLSGTRWGVRTDGPAFNAFCNYMEALLWYGTGWAYNENKNHAPPGPLLQRDVLAGCGRRAQIYREGKGYDDFSKVYRTLERFMKVLPDGSAQKKRLQHCADVIIGKNEQLPVGTRYFWNNDLLICREKDSLAVVSMLSSRVRGIESAPSESHLTDFWSDGAAWIMKHFDSYRIARGFMKPCAIPGVTSRQWEFTHKDQIWRSYSGASNFAGGASDGNYAVCGYHMGRMKISTSPDPNFYDLDAWKAYFWLNGKLICLGAGITDNTSRDIPVATTIDQTLWRGPAEDASGTVRKPGEAFRSESQLLWHDGVGYWILKGKGILSGETRKDRWVEFDGNNRNAENLPKTAPILTFQVDHGRNPKNDSYVYAVDFRCASFADLRKNAKSPSFEILALTPDLQAVREKSSGILAAVFHKPGETGGLSVDAPSVILLRRTPDGEIRATVNDPEQDPKRNSVMLGWNGKYYEIPLPTGVYCGQPVTVNLSHLKPITKEKVMKRTALALALVAAVSCPAQNLIRNPEFQTVDQNGKLTDWKYDPKEYVLAKSDRPEENGKQVVMAKLTAPAEGSGKTRVSAHLRQRIQVKEAGKYQLTLVGKVIGTGVINCSWTFLDQNGKRIPVKGSWWSKACYGGSGKTGWQTVSEVLEIPAGTKSIEFCVTSYADSKFKHKEGSMFIDRVYLAPVTGNQADGKK